MQETQRPLLSVLSENPAGEHGELEKLGSYCKKVADVITNITVENVVSCPQQTKMKERDGKKEILESLVI